MILLPETSVAEYIFFVCPFLETSKTSRLADVYAEWWTETRNFVLAISFTWVKLSSDRIWIRNEELKNTTIILAEFHSIKACELLLRVKFNNTNLIILAWAPSEQLRLWRDVFYFKKRVHVMITTRYIIPRIVSDFSRETPCVSPCNCFDFSSTRLDESSFSLCFGSISCFLLAFLLIWELRVNKF